MGDPDSLVKQIDLTYKNLLDKFNPGSRQLVCAGKAYLKALHGASAASKCYLDILAKLGTQAQQNPFVASNDIGTSILQVVDVYRDIESQHTNLLKAFYVDLLVPLESNIDRDPKVLQNDQKRFAAGYKTRRESCARARASIKKQRGRRIGGRNSIDKEIKNYHILDEELAKMDAYLQKSIQEVSNFERRRYGFVLERLCSIARHHLALYSKGASLLEGHYNTWNQVSETRQSLPLNQDSECIYSTASEEVTEHELDEISSVGVSPNGSRRRARSLDGILTDFDIDEDSYQPIGRTQSDYQIHNIKSNSSTVSNPDVHPRLARAMFSFDGDGTNQLSMEEGDAIVYIGERNKGWQFGKNRRTNKFGWFPAAYTEEMFEEEEDSALGSLDDGENLKREKEAKKETQHTSRSLDRLKTSSPTREVRTRSSPPPNNVSTLITNHTQPMRVKKHPNRPQLPIPQKKPETSYNSDTNLSKKQSKDNSYSPMIAKVTKKNKRSSSTSSIVTFESYNSHGLFLSAPMEEDFENYEKTYLPQTHPQIVSGSDRSSSQTGTESTIRTEKYTSFGLESSISPSLCRSLTSPELPPCFRSSNSSKISLQFSDDSGFSNEETPDRQNNTQTPYTGSYSKSVDSDREIDSSDDYSSTVVSRTPKMSRNSSNSLMSQTPSCDTPTKDYNQDYQLHSKKDRWKLAAMGTWGRKSEKGEKVQSPCANKIIARRQREKKENLSKNSSKSCLDVIGCSKSIEGNYEYIEYSPWDHSSIISLKKMLPYPPPYDPPSPPSQISSPLNQKLPYQRGAHSLIRRLKNKSDKSTEIYTDISEDLQKDSLKPTVSRSRSVKREVKRALARSFTWASQDAKKNRIKSMEISKNSDFYPVASSPTRNSLPRPVTHSISEFNPRKPVRESVLSEGAAPPLPPRSRTRRTVSVWGKNERVNIFNYRDYMIRKLSNPNGTVQFDQKSFSSGQTCSKWYNLWDQNNPMHSVRG